MNNCTDNKVKLDVSLAYTSLPENKNNIKAHFILGVKFSFFFFFYAD